MKTYPSLFYYTSAANLFFFLGNSLFILLPVYLKNLGATETYIGFICNMDKIFMITAAVLIGALLRDRDRIRILRAGYGFLLCTFCLYLPLSGLAWYLPLIRIAHGIGFAVAMIVGTTIVFEQVRPEAATEAIGVYGVTGAISNAISPALGEFLLTRGCHHRVLFVLSVVFILTSFIVTFFMPKPDHVPVRSLSEDNAASPGLLRNTAFLRYGCVTFIFGGGFGVIITFLPNFIRTCTTLNYSAFFMLYIAVLICIRLFCMTIVTRSRVKPLLLAVIALGMLMNLLVNVLYTPAILLLVGVLYGVTHGVLYPVLNALLVALADAPNRGRANALFSALFNAGMLGFACAVGIVIDRLHSYPAAFNICAAAFLVALFLVAVDRSPMTSRRS